MKWLIFLFCCSALYAQGRAELELGFYPEACQVDYDLNTMLIERFDLDNTWYIRVGLGYDYKWIGASGEVETWMLYGKNNFFPVFTSYMVEAYLKYDIWQIGFQHRCSHPVVPHNYLLDPLITKDSSYDYIFLRGSIVF
jgi:hypothetical protein